MERTSQHDHWSAVTSLLDNQGNKRLLYEELGVAEYWVIDAVNAQILDYAILERGSQRIDRSQVFPGLTFTTLEAALRRSRQFDQSQVCLWLLKQF